MKKFLLPIILLITVVNLSCKKTLLVDESAEPGAMQSVNEWDNNPYKLNVVYFVPTDLDTLPQYRERLSLIMFDIQEFYADNMEREGYGRMSFGLDHANGKINIIVVRGKEPKASYPASEGGKILREIEDYYTAHPGVKKSLHSMVYVPEYGNNMSQAYYGSGTNCLVIDYPGLGSTLLKGGGEAHELGHALNLPHNGETKSTKATLGTALMGTGVYTYNGKPTFLTATDCAILSRCQALSTSTRSDWYTTQSLSFTNLAVSTASNTFTISGQFTATMPVSKVVVYHDTKPYGVNDDYDAITFKGSIVGSDSFNVSCPLADFFNTTDTTQLRLKFVFENGYTVDKNVTYTFANNLPVTTHMIPAPIVSGTNYKLVTMLNNSSVLDVAGGLTADGSRTILWNSSNPSPNNQVWKVSLAGSGYYKLEPLHALSKALEVAGNSNANYTQIQISTYTGATGQRWKLQPELGGAYELIPECAPLARMDVENANTANGAKIQLFQSNGHNAQKWRLIQQ